MDDVKLVYTDGDSWTAGDLLDPKMEKKGWTWVNDPRNDAYRLPKVWPHKLGELLGVEVFNNANAGSSNDGIVTRTLSQIPYLLTKFKPEELLVIIGWSSPERKDFYFHDSLDSRQGHWETLYPAQVEQKFKHPGKQEFYKLYLEYFWNKEEYITRFIIQNITLHYYLKSLNIKHKFFNAFYESKAAVDDVLPTFLASPKLEQVINKVLSDKQTGIEEIYKSIYENNYIETSFIGFLKEKQDMYDKTELFSKYHPSEMSHTLWSEFLYNKLTV